MGSCTHRLIAAVPRMTYIFVVVLVSNWVHGLHIYYLTYSRLITQI